MEVNPLGLLFSAIGVFTLCGAIYNWDWFMMSRRARLFVSLFSRDGARIFYGLLGVGLVVFGLLYTAGVIN